MSMSIPFTVPSHLHNCRKISKNYNFLATVAVDRKCSHPLMICFVFRQPHLFATILP